MSDAPGVIPRPWHRRVPTCTFPLVRRRTVAAVRVGELRAQVESRYRSLGMPTWPNPHPDMGSPREEEYSRVTDPERYRIVHTRAEIWTDVLRDDVGVEVETLAPGDLGGEGRLGRFDRGFRLVSPRPATLPLLLLEQDAPLQGQERTLAVVHISVVRPDIALEMLPDCGCDACDSGSQDLLHAIDDTVCQVLHGPFVAMRGEGWRAHWHPDGGSSTGTGRAPAHARLMELCRRLAGGEEVSLPEGAEAFVGRSWLA